ncbi:cytochrome c [Pseudoruegeria sp. M32A2M]|nr:cytochrome c [Pseudoruegeria sp. M32A2M]
MTQIMDIIPDIREASAKREMPMKSVISLLCVLVWMLPVAAYADDALDDGARVFQQACAGCHGAEARGDGPTAALLSVPVPDLTLFARDQDGMFDAARMVRLIDGQEGLAAHGGPMPMFGGLLTGPSEVIDAWDGSPVLTTKPILSIVRWLETQQR